MRIESNIIVIGGPIEKIAIYAVIINRVTSAVEFFKHSEYLQVSSYVFCVFLICGHVEEAVAEC